MNNTGTTIMANNLTARLNALYKNKNTIDRESLKKRIREMKPEDRQKRIFQLKKKAGWENLSPEAIKIKISEFKKQNKQKDY